MAQLAIRGGEPIRRRPWPQWPQWGEEESRGLQRVLESGEWGASIPSCTSLKPRLALAIR